MMLNIKEIQIFLYSPPNEHSKLVRSTVQRAFSTRASCLGHRSLVWLNHAPFPASADIFLLSSLLSCILILLGMAATIAAP